MSREQLERLALDTLELRHSRPEAYELVMEVIATLKERQRWERAS